LDHRSVFRRYVAEALARRTGIPLAEAAAMVEESQLGSLAVGKLNFLSYKGPDYWAEKILEQIGAGDGRKILRSAE
jgi:hypothetical protein